MFHMHYFHLRMHNLNKIQWWLNHITFYQLIMQLFLVRVQFLLLLMIRLKNILILIMRILKNFHNIQINIRVINDIEKLIVNILKLSNRYFQVTKRSLPNQAISPKICLQVNALINASSLEDYVKFLLMISYFKMNIKKHLLKLEGEEKRSKKMNQKKKFNKTQYLKQSKI